MSTHTLNRSGRSTRTAAQTRPARPGRASAGREPALIDPRLQERRREVERGKGRRRLRRVLFVLAAVVFGGAAYAATRSALLDVDHVRVSGATGERATAVTDAAGIEHASPLVNIDPASIEARVSSIPWVLDAHVARRWPGTVAVTVTERVPVAVDSKGSGLDVSGRSLGPVASGRELPTVRGAVVAPGEDLDADLAPVIEVLSVVPEDLSAQVESGALIDHDVVLVLSDGIRVRFGPSRRHSAKFIALDALLDRADRSTIESIDLRVPTSPSLTRRTGSGA